MPKFDVIKTYRAGVLPTETDLDNIKNSYEEFVNVTGLGDDNIQAMAFTEPLIAPNTIFNSKLATNSVTAAKLQDSASDDSLRAVTTTAIKNGSVTQAKLNADIPDGTTIGYSAYSASDNRLQIKTAGVTFDKLKPRPLNGGVAGSFAVSPGSGVQITYGNVPGNYYAVAGMELVLVTTGRPVMITFVPDFQGNAAAPVPAPFGSLIGGGGPGGLGYIQASKAGTHITGMRVFRDATPICDYVRYSGGLAGSFRFIDTPPAGTYTYRIYCDGDIVIQDYTLFNQVRLVAWEI